ARVVDFAVAQQVDLRQFAHVWLPARAAASAAAGSAWAIRSIARSSCAALTNHTSNADGGRYTPASSMAWKNAANRAVSQALAAAKSATGPSAPKKTLNRLPAYCTTWSTPCFVNAAPTSSPIVAAWAFNVAYTDSSARRSVVSPAVVATGFPSSVPAW